MNVNEMVLADSDEGLKDKKIKAANHSASNEGNNFALPLFERIGGQEAIDATVNIFYKKVLGDERISHFFENVDLNYLLDKQKAFLTLAFGGPVITTDKGSVMRTNILWKRV